jgi:transcriptional regulator with XRE-family HTH domain
VTDPAKPGDNPFKLARQLTRHSQADVATALGVSRQTISRYESGEREAPQNIVEWLQINRNQYFSVRPLCTKDGSRGEDLRSARAQELLPQVTRALQAAK